MAQGFTGYTPLPLTTGNGGTSLTSLTAHAVMVGNGTNPVTMVGPGGVGQFFVSNGPTADPSFRALTSSDTPWAAPIASPVFTGTVTLPAGSTTVQPVKFQAGSILTTAVAHSFEWDGAKLYITDSTPTRHTIAYLDSPAFTGPVSSASNFNAVGFSTGYGATNGTSTGAFNGVMGTGANATWLLSGTSGGVFRAGIQVLDAGGAARFYLGTNYAQFTTGTGSTMVLSNLYTQAQGDNTNNVATTAYVDGNGAALGYIEYFSAANARAGLAGNTTATKKFLTQTGNGSVSAAPGWNVIAAADVPVFIASGASHAPGAVPDPGASAGTTRFLREDATWATPASGGISALFKSTSTVTVANTTTETSLFPTGVGSLTIPANGLSVGSYLRLTLRGTCGTTSTTPGNQTIKIKVGGLVVVTAAIAEVSSGGGFTEIIADLYVTASGVSGSINGVGRWARYDSSALSTLMNPLAGTAQTINTTGTLAVDCTMTWATANASNTITINTATLEQL